ncbi:non-ribosomal peptide synthetase [Apodospora peruviana]|uniref:Non-ribosomal peptide synthetase n=1 Tax=Apodospora peruviana TaxID=516989 RepID=A0AAE0LYW6_9PEZI|nr:non-ribosomal peptide synthetase [Apodospora peruviana]
MAPAKLLRPDTNTTSASAQLQEFNPLLGVSRPDPLGLGISWTNTLDASQLLSLVDQHVSFPAVFSAAGYVKMVAEVCLKFCSGSRALRSFELDDFYVQNNTILERKDEKIQITLELQSTGSHDRGGDRTDFINFRIRTAQVGTTAGAKLNALGCVRLRTSSGGHRGLSIATPTTALDGPGQIPDSETPPTQTASRRAVDNDSTGDPSSNDKHAQLSNQPKVIKALPMSSGQSGFWFMTQFVQDPTFFNGTVSFLITTRSLDIELLSRLVQGMASRHEGLRTAFFTDPKTHQPVQAVLTESPLHLETKTITSPDRVRAEIDATNRHVYDIARGETIRLLLLSESPNRHHLIVGYHHINIDGMSVIAIVEDLRLAYEGKELPPPFQQNEFAARQRERLRTGQYAADILFWKNEFRELPEILPILPVSPNTALRSRPATRTTYRHVRAERRLDPAVTARLQDLRTQGHVQSPFSFYLTVFQILLGRLTQSEDLCIGVASANRQNDPGSTDSIGIFLNLFALRLRSELSKSFLALLKETKTKVLAGLQHSAVPFDAVLDEVGAIRSPSHSPLFQAFINYIPVREHRSFGDGTIENKEYEIGETIYDIMLAVIDPPTGDPWIAIMVQKELYSQQDAQILLDCFMNLMEAFTRDIRLPGRTPQMFNQVAVQKAIELGQGLNLDIGLGSLIGRLDNISAKQAGEIALRDTHGGTLTYADMMAKSVRIACALSASGVGSRSRIGVLQEPTVGWMCSMLAIWRFGGSYVPLEVVQGVGRLKSIVRDADLAAILVHDATRTLCGEIGVSSTMVILDVATVGENGKGNVAVLEFYNPKPADEAIVLYTSGSTGVPKGISLPHRMVTNTIMGFLHSFPMRPQTVLQQIALSFDVSWWQSLLGLATGGSVVIAGKNIRRDPVALTNLIATQNITLTLSVPSEATSWLQNGNLDQLRQSAWEWHISAGEEIGPNLVKMLRAVSKPDLRFVNAYGPAETIIPHAYEVPYRDAGLLKAESSHTGVVPIGKVLPNYSVYVMDQDNHPLPAGVPGQIVIGGAGVASGYVKQPELTAARFPKNLLADARAVASGWTHAHLSGDRGYMREDGVFVALGRMNGDTQVKLRGQRFELREVEAALVAAGKGDILEAVTHIRRHKTGDAASAFLVAHVVLTPGTQRKYGGTTNGPVVDSKLRKIVADLPLPSYMRPSVVVALPSMPLNHHGKVDRRFLYKTPLPNVKGTLGEPEKTLTRAELLLPGHPSTTVSRESIRRNMTSSTALEVIEQIWKDVLGDLITGPGGPNVKSKIKERTGHDIPLVNLFENSSLGKMTAQVTRQGKSFTNTSEQYKQQKGGPQLPEGSAQDKMKQIWLSVLGDIVGSPQSIGPKSDFFLVGGNSLLLISIQKEVKKEFGILLPLAKLFEASTPAQMSTLLLNSLADANVGTTVDSNNINWQDEVAFTGKVPANFVAATTAVDKEGGHIDRDAVPVSVVLTGATGFLGRHILEQLVNNPMVRTVHCVTVRDISKLSVNSPKVVVHRGDLRDSRLGLSDNTTRRIFTGVSAIIHNGADVSFLRGYRTVRAANVLSTKTLVQLAIKYYAGDSPLPHFHFISTAGVAQLGTTELYEEPLIVAQPPPWEKMNGYVASKWASEKYLENARAVSGLPVTIHRPSYIVGPDAPQLDVMHNILRFAEKMRSVPRMPAVDRWLQFVGIDEVARDIAADVLRVKASNGVQYQNHCGDEKDWVRLDQLGAYLERTHGGVSFSEVEFRDWIDAAGRAGMPAQVGEYLRSLVIDDNAGNDNSRTWIYPRVLKGPRSNRGHGPWRRQGKL